MQFCQPGYSYTGPPCNTPYILNGYPEIVGEGNIASVMSPDGSLQLVFVPTTQWLRPLQCHNGNTANWTPTAAWFIRSVLSPLQPTNPYCQNPQPCFQPVSSNSHSNYEFNPAPCRPPSRHFELKFHNDTCTSTSDILYFYPKLRTYDSLPWAQPRKCPSVQLVVPPPSCGFVNQTTSLRSGDLEPMETVIRTTSPSPATSSCDMSDDANNRVDCLCLKESKKSRKQNKKSKTLIKCECREDKKNTKRKPKKNNINCECKQEMDKRVATFTDQASSCIAEKGIETQTDFLNVCETQTCAIKPIIKTRPCERSNVSCNKGFPGVCILSGCTSSACSTCSCE